ncbi:hypothetical protein N7476_003017 [Penicillium atrosanguineum]|uniref:Zn(2)-C6 fungal-type domain-containing protein n=1 Tax=Penicillium atrosanguineum TaxID=1132637 RepID=A0A9W9Q714_9EURO|nr:hypothetical protein N7476_003017 [Penicillium atrosanguineum]
MTGRSKPPRTHSLGGCTTCRRRHVKCDQNKPSCQMCSSVGFRCEGYPGEIRWMPDEKNHTSAGTQRGKRKGFQRSGTRHHLYTGNVPDVVGFILLMSTALGNGLLSGSIDASLEEIDTKSQEPFILIDNDFRIGPFAVLNLNLSVGHSEKCDAAEKSIGPALLEAPTTTFPVPSAPNIQPPISESASHSDDLLQWSDLFGLNDDIYGITSNLSLVLVDCPDFAAYPGLFETEGERNIDSMGALHEEICASGQDEYSSTDTQAPINIVTEASFLLNIFQKHVVPRLTVIPLGKKSPWSVLNVPAAMVTLGDMTILELPDVNHARKANLFSLLACAAFYITMTPSSGLVDENVIGYWRAYAHQCYNEAKGHMQLSLSEETRGPTKAKYKDQLMAIFGMIESAIFQGQHQDARCYMINAERLLRLRGLEKQRTSRKVRLLVNVYTWLRIVGESTYVLHDYGASSSFVKALTHQIETRGPNPYDNGLGLVKDRNVRLDDFVHLEHSENDLNIDDPKDQNKDLPDIHLHDSRRSLHTLAKQVYGISETWLSLVSQTTRLANVLEKLKAAQASSIPIESVVWVFVQKRMHRLESVIHSFGDRKDDAEPPEGPIEPYTLIIRALNTALVILFYRRVHKVHSGILDFQVEKVITALKSLCAMLPGVIQAGPGLLWPVFIAGSEAMEKEKRDAILQLITMAESNCGLASFKVAKSLMLELWQRQDEHLATNRHEPLPTWIDVLREHQNWPMFC